MTSDKTRERPTDRPKEEPTATHGLGTQGGRGSSVEYRTYTIVAPYTFKYFEHRVITH